MSRIGFALLGSFLITGGFVALLLWVLMTVIALPIGVVLVPVYGIVALLWWIGQLPTSLLARHREYAADLVIRKAAPCESEASA